MLTINKIRNKIRAFAGDNDNKEVVQSSAIIFMLKVFFALIGFVISIVITRFLSVADAGYYFFMLAMVALLSSVSRLGVDNAIVRFTAVANSQQDFKKIKAINALSLKVALAGSLFTSVVLWLFCKFAYSFVFEDDGYLLPLQWTVYIVPLISCSVVYSQSFQGLKKVKLFALFNAVVRPINLFILVIIILTTEKLVSNAVYASYFVASLLALLLASLFWYRCINVVQHDSKVLDQQETSEDVILNDFQTDFFKSCHSLWAIACLAILMGQGAQVLLGVFASVEDVAHFAVANRVAMLMSFVLLAVNGILSPKFAEIAAENDNQRLQKIYRSSTKVMLVITSPLLIISFIFAPSILLLFGEQYQQSSTILRILIAAQFVKVVVGSVGQLLIMSGAERSQKHNLAISVFLLTIVSVALIPLYGALGAAIAAFIAISTNNLLGLFKVFKTLKISLF